MQVTRREPAALQPYRATSLDDQLGRMMESMFEDMFAPLVGYSPIGRPEGVQVPRLNLSENELAYEIEAEVPGVDKDNVKIAIDGRRVSIEAQQQEEQQTDEGGRTSVSRSMRRYARSFTLPQEVDDEKAQARLENGVLSLNLPKKASAQGRVLSVQ